jgi:transcriptional regulator with XRE-family HTH domain
MPRRRPPPTPPETEPQPDPWAEVDLNQVVAYNVRAARELRGWTQEEFAARLEPYIGQRLTQASVSGIERAWDGDRRREFDAQELLFFALVFDLPIVWFLIPPPGDNRMMRNTTRPVAELYAHLLGFPHQLDPLYARLREIRVDNPSTSDEVFKLLTGTPTGAHNRSYRERRKELLLALLDTQADTFDNAVEDLGRVVDRLRTIGIRGFLAENTNDRDFARADWARREDEATRADTGATPDETAPAGTARRSRPTPTAKPDETPPPPTVSRAKKGGR